MVDRYEIRKQDGKWQVFVEKPPKGMTPCGWITCQTEAHAYAIAEAPVLEHKFELGDRGEVLAKGFDLASKAMESSMVGNERIGSCILSRHYSSLAEEARGTEVD